MKKAIFAITILMFVGYLGILVNRPQLNINKQIDVSDVQNRDKIDEKTIRTISQLETEINKLLKTNTIHSVNVEYNEVRIDPLIWQLLLIETKQQLVLTFSTYFELKGSTGRVTILSNRSDKKLAKYSTWTGIIIYE